MSETISNLASHTGFWMRMISNAVSQDFARRLAGEGVTVAEWVFLRALHDETSLSPSVLAEKMGMTKGAISKLSERLVEKGLVTRAEDETDRRAHHLALSAEGRAKVPHLAALADANDAEAFGVLSAEEHTELDRLLRLLAERRGLSSIPID